MHSIRRAALRAASSTPRAFASKAQPLSSARQPFASLRPRAGIAAGVFALRAFSQSARALNTGSAAPAEFDFSAGEGASGGDSVEGAENKDPTPYGVFVRNMVFDATEEHLQEIFGQYGEIVSSQIARDPRGLSRGYGFVFFREEKSQDEAVATVNGSFWHGRRIAVAKRTPQDAMSRNKRLRGPASAPGEPTSCLFIGNIPYETTDSELNRIFRDLPGLRDVRVAVDRQTGWPRGFAHCDFIDVPSAEEAMKRLAGVNIAGRPLRVDYAAVKGVFNSQGADPAPGL